MAVSRAMRRLLRLLEMQEEKCLAEMEAALADLRKLKGALAAAQEQDRAGRRLVTASAVTGEMIDRLAGLEEGRDALRRTGALKPRFAEAQTIMNTRRAEFLSKRVERRQAETVVEQMQDADAADAGRREQRGLDDWFLGKMRQGR
jgi:hypothetical protein